MGTEANLVNLLADRSLLADLLEGQVPLMPRSLLPTIHPKHCASPIRTNVPNSDHQGAASMGLSRLMRGKLNEACRGALSLHSVETHTAEPEGTRT